MAQAPISMTSGSQAAPQSAGKMAPLVVGLFFIWGFSTVLVDTLIPKLKALFSLSFTEVMLTQFAFFIAYFLVSVPAGRLLAKIGYVRGIVTGLVVMAIGGLMFAPAASLGVFPGFLAALFVLASGITILQVAANPLIAILGDPARSHSRLTLAQAFNSLGTTIGPWVGAVLILKGMVDLPAADTLSPVALAALRKTEAQVVQVPFLGIAAVLLAMAAVFWALRNWKGAPQTEGAEGGPSSLALITANPRLALGVASIFAYVGAEVSIGSVMANYLMQPTTLGLAALEAGKLISLYWGGAMIGRFLGAGVLRYVSPGKVLAACAVAAGALAATSGLSTGMLAAVSLISIGLFNSIMFPTIFSLGIEGLGKDTAKGSGLLCMAIVGGAVVPLATGGVADHLGLGLALFVPVVCYAVIAAFGWFARKPALA